MEQVFRQLLVSHFGWFLLLGHGDLMNDNLISVIEKFGTDDKCRACLVHLKWPNGIDCPRCHSKKISRLKARDTYDCDSCRYQFSVTAGSIFHDSHLPLTKWFLATYVIVESKKGISANQLKRMIGVSYKTAWYLCHRIRKAMTEVNPKPLGGPDSTIEIDETYIGGHRHHMGRGYRDNKTMVMGAIERGGKMRLQVEKRHNRWAAKRFIEKTTAPDTARIITDESNIYSRIEDADTKHESVNHSQEEWVRGDVHTNNVEYVWSLFKRSIVGSYHQISAKHMDAYLDEFEWRFNERENPYLFRDTLVRLLNSPKMEFKELVEKSA
jgi:transposase-like protein